MLKHVVLLSGHVSAGKSTLARALSERFSAKVLRTKDFLLDYAPRTKHRRDSLQRVGEKLDRNTNGGWVARELAKALGMLNTEPAIVIMDAVRIKEQIDGVRQAYGPLVTHIHVDAPVEVLAKRYKERNSDIQELKSYDEVLRNKTERLVGRLNEVADVVIDTARCTAEDVVVRAASYLRLYGQSSDRLVDLVIGGQYGSEGKGHVASYIAREYDIFIRTGGPNAGHTIYNHPEATKVHQLPSGTARKEDAQLMLAPGSVLDVQGLLAEIAQLRVDKDRLSIDPQAMVIETKDLKVEQALVASIGSTGKGVGSATARRILQRGNPELRLARDVPELKPYVRATSPLLERAYAEQKKILLEGTQGTALSLYHGEYPFVTSRDTSASGCLAEAGIAPTRVRRIIMVCRTYPIRVQSPPNGTSGRIGQELTWNEVAARSGIDVNELLKRERTTTTNRQRRVAEFDWQLFQKAVLLNGPTDIALTFTDYLTLKNRLARRFDQLDPETIQFINELERVARTPVSLISTRFHYRSIIDRRAW